MHVQVVAGGADSLSQCVDTARMPLSLGGLGVWRSSFDKRRCSLGQSADCLKMIAQRHLLVAQAIVNGVGTASGCFASVVAAMARLQEAGLEIPTWQSFGVWAQTTTGKSVPPQWCRSPTESRSCCLHCPPLNRPWCGLRVDHWRPSHVQNRLGRVQGSRVASSPFAVVQVCAILPVWPSFCVLGGGTNAVKAKQGCTDLDISPVGSTFPSTGSGGGSLFVWRMPVGHRRHLGLSFDRRRDAETQGGHDRWCGPA